MMAFTGKGGLGCYCLQPHSGDLVHGCAPVPCLTCTDQFQLQDNHKAGPPRGGEEWRCYTCQRVYTGRATHYGQDSKLLCELCRTSSEYDFVETSYMYHEAPTRYYGGRRGQSRQAGVRKRQPMLPLVRRPRAESRDALNGQCQTLRSFSKSAIDKCSKFCYQEKGSGEECVLRVSQLGATTELVWGYNGTTIHCGQENCVRFNASNETAGVYLFFELGMNSLLLVHVISMKKEGEDGCSYVISMKKEGEGSRPQPLGSGELFLPPNNDQLSDAYSDNNPVPCPECESRGTIFLDPEYAVISQAIGQSVTVRVTVCAQEMNKFRFIWQCNNAKFTSGSSLSFTFEALKPSYCMCIAVSPSSGEELYKSVVFEVLPAGAATSTPLTVPTVRQEVTPSLSQGVTPQPSASQLAGTASSLSSQLNLAELPDPTDIPFGQPEQESHSIINPSSMVFSSVRPSTPAAVNPVCHLPQSERDSEPQSKPSESDKVKDFLIKELVESGASRRADFSLLSLARSPTCSPCIRGFIERAATTQTCNSEQHILEHVVQLICQETTLDTAVSLRRCIALAYELICSLRDDEQNAFHQSLGTRLMQNVPFPPLLRKWSQGPSASLPRGESVSLSVTACNANSFNWLCNGVPVGCPNEPYYHFPVDPSTCGDYRCSVRNRHGCVQTPPTEISMSDEPTSYSVTNTTLETTYNLGITPQPSTSLEGASVEDEKSAIGGRQLLVPGTEPPSHPLMEQVVPGAISTNDSRGSMMEPARRDRFALHQSVPRRRLLFEPPSPHGHSRTVRTPDSRLP